jgi:hypothetical protein
MVLWGVSFFIPLNKGVHQVMQEPVDPCVYHVMNAFFGGLYAE